MANVSVNTKQTSHIIAKKIMWAVKRHALSKKVDCKGSLYLNFSLTISSQGTVCTSFLREVSDSLQISSESRCVSYVFTFYSSEIIDKDRSCISLQGDKPSFTPDAGKLSSSAGQSNIQDSRFHLFIFLKKTPWQRNFMAKRGILDYHTCSEKKKSDKCCEAVWMLKYANWKQ